MRLSAEAVARMAGPELVAALADYADESLRGHSADAEDRLLAQLPRAVQVVHLLGWLEFEVLMGSFLAFFDNSHGRHAALAAEALHDIGAPELARVVEEARSVHAAVAAQWREQREVVHAAVSEYDIVLHPFEHLERTEELSALTDRFHEVANGLEPCWGERLEQFVLAHRAQVMEHLRREQA